MEQYLRVSPRTSRGFTLLFSVLVSGILLAIGLSIFNIVYRELQLSMLTRDSDTAIFAADTGIECGLFWEFKGMDQTPPVSFTPGSTAPVTIRCSETDLPFSGENISSATTTWTFNLPVGASASGGTSCAQVIISKSRNAPFRTAIESNGRNEGGASCTPGTRTVERTLEVSF